MTEARIARQGAAMSEHTPDQGKIWFGADRTTVLNERGNETNSTRAYLHQIENVLDQAEQDSYEFADYLNLTLANRREIGIARDIVKEANKGLHVIRRSIDNWKHGDEKFRQPEEAQLINHIEYRLQEMHEGIAKAITLIEEKAATLEAGKASLSREDNPKKKKPFLSHRALTRIAAGLVGLGAGIAAITSAEAHNNNVPTVPTKAPIGDPAWGEWHNIQEFEQELEKLKEAALKDLSMVGPEAVKALSALGGLVQNLNKLMAPAATPTFVPPTRVPTAEYTPTSTPQPQQNNESTSGEAKPKPIPDGTPQNDGGEPNPNSGGSVSEDELKTIDSFTPDTVRNLKGVHSPGEKSPLGYLGGYWTMNHDKKDPKSVWVWRAHMTKEETVESGWVEVTDTFRSDKYDTTITVELNPEEMHQRNDFAHPTNMKLLKEVFGPRFEKIMAKYPDFSNNFSNKNLHVSYVSHIDSQQDQTPYLMILSYTKAGKPALAFGYNKIGNDIYIRIFSKVDRIDSIKYGSPNTVSAILSKALVNGLEYASIDETAFNPADLVPRIGSDANKDIVETMLPNYFEDLAKVGEGKKVNMATLLNLN